LKLYLRRTKIDQVSDVFKNKILIDFWNIGSRPISHLLIQMSDSLNPEDRRRIKKEWVGIFFEIFKLLVSLEQTYTLEKSPYLTFVLSK